MNRFSTRLTAFIIIFVLIMVIRLQTSGLHSSTFGIPHTAYAGFFSSSATSIGLDEPLGTFASNTTNIDVVVRATSVINLGAWEFDLSYDENMVDLVSMDVDTAFAKENGCDGAAEMCAIKLGPLLVADGVSGVGAFSYGSFVSHSGSLDLATLHFAAKGCPGTTDLSITNLLAADTAGGQQTVTHLNETLTLTSPDLDLGGTFASDDVNLSWSSPQCSYALHRQNTPYFGLNAGNLLTNLASSSQMYTDENAGIATNYYYSLAGLSSDGGTVNDQADIGVFHFTISPGS